MLDEPVRPPVAALHVEAAAEGSAGFQNAAGFAVSGLLVREGVKAIHGQHDIEAFILKRQRADVALHEGDIPDPRSLRLLLRRGHHVLGIIQAGDLCVRKVPVDRHGQDACPDRNF